MESRELGKTGERIPVVGMGTWALGNSSGEQRREEIKALQKGIELGMKFIDTAEVYGHGRSESLVGDAIRDYRDEVFLATKVAPENFAYDDIIRSCETSIQRLGVKFVDLYQLHWPNPRIPIQETMRAMEELVATGKTRYIGCEQLLGRADNAGAGIPTQERAGLESGEVQHHLPFHRGRPAPLLREGEDYRDSV